MSDNKSKLTADELDRINGGTDTEGPLCPRCGGIGMLTPDIIDLNSDEQPQPGICPDCGGTGRC